MKEKNTRLAGRQQPVQDRSKESVDRILEMTARLLDEVGIEGFNTNLLAQRTGVRVRTVYRYFPNKYAVIFALTKKLAVQWDAWMVDFYRLMADPRSDWRRLVRESDRKWVQHARTVPGALSVLQAMNATPELKALHFQVFEEMSKKLAVALKARGVKQSRSKLLAIARTVIIATNTRTETYLQLKGRDAEEFWEEVTLSGESYLERYLAAVPGIEGDRGELAGSRGRRRVSGSTAG
ncbi:MAG TPA: TetR/AcrR family transcriptional regulator [Steroidobacteraceae bacterium]|nr:TetR/AcrR family transcriptional regulator [Steroidobacteraceae bacterium]